MTPRSQGPAADRTGPIRRALASADITVIVASGLVLVASWAAVGYAIGRWAGMVVGGVVGLAAGAALAAFIGRLKV